MLPKQAPLVRGPRDFSRVLGLSFQGPRGAGAPCSGVAVSSSVCFCCPEVSSKLSTSLSLGIPIDEKSPNRLFSSPGSFLPGSVRAGPGCLAARRRPLPLRAAVEGAAIWSTSSNQAIFFDAVRSIFQSYPQVVDKSGACSPYSEPRSAGGPRRERASRSRREGSRVVHEPNAERFPNEEDLRSRR